MRCKGCGRLVGIEVNIEKRTYGYSQTKYQEVLGVYRTPSGRIKLELADSHSEWVEPDVTYQCDYCGREHTEEEVIFFMEQLAKLDKED